MLKYFRKDRQGGAALIAQTDRVLTKEERDEIIEEFRSLTKSQVKALVEVLNRTYTISDIRIKSDKLKIVEELLASQRLDGICSDLSGVLKSSVDGATKGTVLRLLSYQATENDVPALVSLLQSGDSETRRAGLKILAALPPSAVAAELTRAVEDDQWVSKIEALDLLYDISRIDCIRVCRQIMRDASEAEQRQAIRVLSKLASDEAVSVLNDGLSSTIPRIRVLVAQALVKIGTAATLHGLHRCLTDDKAEIIFTALEGLRNLGSRKPIPDIVPLMEHPNIEVQIRAIEVIGYLGNEEEVMSLVGGMKHPDLRVRQMATDAIIRISEKQFTNISKLLLGLMSDRDVNVRRCVVEVLNRISDASLFEEIFKFLRDEDWWVREAVAETLAKIQDERVVPAAIQLLDHEDEIMRRYGIEILVGIRDARAVQPIIRLLNDPDWWVRERAVEALGYLGDTKIVPLLISMLRIKELTYTAVMSLGELRDPRAIDPLIKLLSQVQPEHKVVILEALAKLDARSAIDTIKAMLVDVDKGVRLKAREVLRKLEVDLGDALAASDRWWEKHNMGLLDKLLLEIRASKATDMLLVSNLPPIYRIQGALVERKTEPMTEEAILELVMNILHQDQEEYFRNNNDLDFSYEIPGEGRFRGNMFRHREGINAVFRLIPDKPPDINDLQLPEVVGDFIKLKQGLVLITGSAACGKTSTMAALVNEITRTRYDHIITIEDPIEFLYDNNRALVTQREVGRHSRSFSLAIRAALREDPDVIVVGELRDHETISMAITAAETGHLILSTLHSLNAPKTIDRIIDVFPTGQQDQIRIMLSESLKAVISQQLVFRKDNRGRVAAFEILLSTPAVSNLIREGKVFQIPSIMVTSRQQGMQTMDQALADLVHQDVISAEEALIRSQDKEIFQQMVEMEQRPD